jgi:hypothetical protein
MPPRTPYVPEKKTRTKKVKRATATNDELADEPIRTHQPAVECPVHRGKFHEQGAFCSSCPMPNQPSAAMCPCGLKVANCADPWHEYARWIREDPDTRWAWHFEKLEKLCGKN